MESPGRRPSSLGYVLEQYSYNYQMDRNIPDKMAIYDQLFPRLKNWSTEVKIKVPKREDILTLFAGSDNNVEKLKRVFSKNPQLNFALAIYINLTLTGQREYFYSWLLTVLSTVKLRKMVAVPLYALLWATVHNKEEGDQLLRTIKLTNNLDFARPHTDNFYNRALR